MTPAARFAEDRLRLQGAVRFAARSGFTIASSTRAAITESATVAWERIGDKGDKLLTDGARVADSVCWPRPDCWTGFCRNWPVSLQSFRTRWGH